MKRFGTLLLAAVLGSLVTIGAFQWLANDQDGVSLNYLQRTPASNVAYHINEDGEAVPLDFTGTAEKVTPAVVHIRSTRSYNSSSSQQPAPEYNPFREFFFGPDGPRMQPQPSQASGSGVIINAKGYIVTNNHVVQNADIVDVTLYDNRTFKAEVIGTDPDTDIALIKIAEEDLPFIPFVDSDKAKVGEWVLAVGNPFNLNSTVTAGIISAKGRNINIIDRRTENGNSAIEAFIQTDAAINPGNSGGALVNLEGGLIGINTAIASPTGSYSGYGFAVPANLVSKIVEDLLNYGVVQRGWLGVSIRSIDSDLVREHELEVNRGAFISAFAENSAAKEGGLKEGDVVVKIDEKVIDTSTDLIATIGGHRPGDKVRITVNRDGKELTYPVTLKTREGKTTIVKLEERKGVAALNIQVEKVEEGVLNKLELKNGVRVTSIGNGKVARYTDIREGFIITKVNDRVVSSPEQLNEMLEEQGEGEIVTLSGTYEDFPREFLYSFRM